MPGLSLGFLSVVLRDGRKTELLGVQLPRNIDLHTSDLGETRKNRYWVHIGLEGCYFLRCYLSSSLRGTVGLEDVIPTLGLRAWEMQWSMGSESSFEGHPARKEEPNGGFWGLWASQ